MIVTQREREAETQAEGEAGSMHREPDVGLDPGSSGSRPGPKAGTKPLSHPGIPEGSYFSTSSPILHGTSSFVLIHANECIAESHILNLPVSYKY